MAALATIKFDSFYPLQRIQIANEEDMQGTFVYDAEGKKYLFAHGDIWGEIGFYGEEYDPYDVAKLFLNEGEECFLVCCYLDCMYLEDTGFKPISEHAQGQLGHWLLPKNEDGTYDLQIFNSDDPEYLALVAANKLLNEVIL